MSSAQALYESLKGRSTGIFEVSIRPFFNQIRSADENQIIEIVQSVRTFAAAGTNLEARYADPTLLVMYNACRTRMVELARKDTWWECIIGKDRTTLFENAFGQDIADPALVIK